MNAITKNEPKTVQSYLKMDNVKQRFFDCLQSAAPAYMSGIISVMNSDNNLKECTPESIIGSALISASLKLPINKQLGYAYLIPFKNKGISEAQFQIGYKGLIQLALRSGAYRNINVTEIFDGELINFDRVSGYIETDFAKIKSSNIVGYCATFELLNGFKKMLYMTAAEIKKHAEKYSKTYKFGGVWKSDFDAMAKKTVLKLLLMKYGILSVEMQTIHLADQAVINPNFDGSENLELEYKYTDNLLTDNNSNYTEIELTALEKRTLALIDAANTIEELNDVSNFLTPNIEIEFENKMNNLKTK